MTPQTNAFSADDFESAFPKMRRAMFWAGLAMTLLGGVALTMPLLGSFAAEIFVGWLLIMSGIISLIAVFDFRYIGLFVWQMLSGLMTFAAGLLLLIFPVEGLVALTLLVAVIFFLTGAAQSAFAFWMRPARGWVWALLSASVSIVLGGFIVATLPDASTIVLGLFVGIDFVSTGVAFVLIARSAKQPLRTSA